MCPIANSLTSKRNFETSKFSKELLEKPAKFRIAHVEIGTSDTSGQKNSVDVRDVPKEIVIAIAKAKDSVVLLALSVEVIRSIDFDKGGLRIEHQVGTDYHAGVVEVVALNRMNRSDLVKCIW